jgi:hypothetical protein
MGLTGGTDDDTVVVELLGPTDRTNDDAAGTMGPTGGTDDNTVVVELFSLLL